MDDILDTPERLMDLATKGRLSKHALATFLAIQPRQAFLEACAAIEKKYTEQCAAANDPCLESGCSMDGEVCLEPLARSGTEYHKACAAEWVKLFANRENRA